MNYKDIIKKQSFIITISVIVMGVVLIGTSFALFSNSSKSTTTQVVKGGTFNLDYSASVITTQTGDINPQAEGDAPVYQLSVENKGTIDSTYNIIIYTTSTNEVDPSNIMVKIGDETAKTLSSLTKTKETASETDMNKIKYVLATKTVEYSQTQTSNIKVWVAEDADDSIEGQTIGVDMSVEAVVAQTAGLE